MHDTPAANATHTSPAVAYENMLTPAVTLDADSTMQNFVDVDDEVSMPPLEPINS
jgi:hypothetical protein